MARSRLSDPLQYGPLFRHSPPAAINNKNTDDASNNSNNNNNNNYDNNSTLSAAIDTQFPNVQHEGLK